MAYTNSPLVGYTRLVDKHSGERTHAIDRITPHCVVGQVTAARLGDIFSGTRAVSSNYGIALDGTVGLYVEEKNRSWCSSSNANDQRAITIECASDPKPPYAFKPVVYETLVQLCIDICKRNGKKKLLWFGVKTKSLNYSLKSAVRFGARGGAVAHQQGCLGKKEKLDVDGHFGVLTKAAVLSFQRKHRLATDAIVGSKQEEERAALKKAL